MATPESDGTYSYICISCGDEFYNGLFSYDDDIYNSISFEEYKNSCIEISYDDLFFGDDSIERKPVKLRIMLEELRIWNDLHLTDSMPNFVEDYNLNTNYYSFGVARTTDMGLESFVGGSGSMFFPNASNLKPDNYKLGQKLNIYGEVYELSPSLTTGYNTFYFIVRFID